MIFAAIFIVAVLGSLGFLAVLGARSKKEYDASNEVVPGRPTSAPASWAGSHEPAARLHRRLRDAMAAMRANRSFDDNPMLIDLRVELEEQALALDERLVAAAALPQDLRGEPMAQAAEHTQRIEAAVASLAGRTAADALPALQSALDAIRERTELVGESTNALDDQVLDPYAGLPAAPSVDGPVPVTSPTGPATEPPLIVSEPAVPATEPPVPATEPPAPATEPPAPGSTSPA